MGCTRAAKIQGRFTATTPPKHSSRRRHPAAAPGKSKANAISSTATPPVGTHDPSAAQPITLGPSDCRLRTRITALSNHGVTAYVSSSAQLPISRRSKTKAFHTYSEAATTAIGNARPRTNRATPTPARINAASSTTFCSIAPGIGPASVPTITSCGTARGKPPSRPNIHGSSVW